MEVTSHKFLNLEFFRYEGFIFQEWLEYQGLGKFVQMTEDCYLDLVEVSYANLKLVNSFICSRVKGVNVKIDEEMWNSFVGIKTEGYSSHLGISNISKMNIYKDCLRFPNRPRAFSIHLNGGMKREERLFVVLLAWILLPGRGIHDKLSTEDVYLIHALKNIIPTN